MNDGREHAGAEQMNVGAILAQLRAEVRARRLAQGVQAISPLERELQRDLDQIELYRVVSAHWPLTGKTLPQRVVALINKLVRRYLRWYINPIVEQQNAYNDTVARALRLLAEAYAELGAQIAESQEQQQRGDQGSRRQPAAEAPSTAAAQGAPPPHSHDPCYAELMASVRAQAAAEPPARFPDLELRAVEPHLRLRQEVNAHWPLTGKTLPQRVIALANKLVRRYLRWYINPIVEQQNAANAAITRALLHLIALDAARRAEVARYRANRLGGQG